MTDYKTLLTATDFSPLAAVAHQAAMDLAKAVGSKRIHFEHVVQTGGSSSGLAYPFADWEIERIFEQGLAEAKRNLDAIKVDLPGVEVTRHARLGVLGRELAKAAEEVKADLVIVASHGYGTFKRTFLGSAASGLVRASHCPILVVGENRPAQLPFKRVMAALDLSPISEKILAHAVGLTAPGGEVTVLSLYEYPLVSPNEHDVLPRYISKEEIQRYGEQHAQRIQAIIDKVPHPGVDVKVEVMAKAPASQVILDVAQMTNPDLVVIGTSGHSAWHRMMIGSTATRVLNEATRPVLVVPFDVKS
ncbi:MAG: universal stress protein [Deltaproteobacteria bacterium]|nr:universal stress protein [Deltaproteobacteria bacterium]